MSVAGAANACAGANANAAAKAIDNVIFPTFLFIFPITSPKLLKT